MLMLLLSLPDVVVDKSWLEMLCVIKTLSHDIQQRYDDVSQSDHGRDLDQKIGNGKEWEWKWKWNGVNHHHQHHHRYRDLTHANTQDTLACLPAHGKPPSVPSWPC